MKIVDFFESQVKIEVEKIRPPEDIRPKLDIGYKYENRTFEIFEISPNWMNENESIETSVAKCRFIKSKQVWKIYWKRASGKWELYKPSPEHNDLTGVFETIKEDAYACFWG